jgi:hypothetical protein
MKPIKPIFVAIIFVIALIGGYGIGRANPVVHYEYLYLPSAPETIEVTKEILKVIKQTEYIDRPAFGKDLRQFRDYYELKDWLSEHWVEDMGGHECVAEALEMVRRGYDDGYLISTEALMRGAVERRNVPWHMVNSTVIGKGIYFFDPVERIIWKAGHVAGRVE